MMDRDHTCCFTGHRHIPDAKAGMIIKRLNQAIDFMVYCGVTEFLSGGAIGFDQLAASAVLAKRDAGKRIRLTFVLPCADQDALWNKAQRALYRRLLGEANETVYLAYEYTAGCMNRRNHYLIDHSAHCICALLHPRSGTGQTVRYAQRQGLHIVNVADGAEKQGDAKRQPAVVVH